MKSKELAKWPCNFGRKGTDLTEKNAFFLESLHFLTYGVIIKCHKIEDGDCY
jgi:hypothetical protein